MKYPYSDWSNSACVHMAAINLSSQDPSMREVCACVPRFILVQMWGKLFYSSEITSTSNPDLSLLRSIYLSCNSYQFLIGWIYITTTYQLNSFYSLQWLFSTFVIISFSDCEIGSLLFLDNVSSKLWIKSRNIHQELIQWQSISDC